MQAGFSAGCCIIPFNVRRKVEVEGNVELITPLLCRSFGSVLQQGMLVRLVQIRTDLSLFHREHLICGQSSDATERESELHGLGYIRNILRVDIGTGQSSTIQKGIVALYLQQQGYTSFDLAKHYQVPANRVRAWQSKARKLLQQDDALYALLT